MKLRVELDLTPQELRKVLGLPDIENIQKAAVDKIQGIHGICKGVNVILAPQQAFYGAQDVFFIVYNCDNWSFEFFFCYDFPVHYVYLINIGDCVESYIF